MKIICKLFLIQILFISCNDKKEFKVGDCIQKPDSVIVWKIKSKNKENYTLFQQQDKREPSIKTIKLKDIWTKSNCPNF